MTTYDAVVVGSRCAGAATALSLASAGHRVLMVDQASFPSDTMSTLYIHQPGVALLADWGVLDSILDTGCPPITGLSHTVAGSRISGRLPSFQGVDFAIAPRRFLLDQKLVNAAVALGVEFRPSTKVVGLIHSDGRVTGVRLRSADGSVSAQQAQVVIAADGMRSTVAGMCGAVTTIEDRRRTFVYYSAWRLKVDQVQLVEEPGRYLSVIPTNETVCLIATYGPQIEFASARRDAMTFHRGVIQDLAPELDALLDPTLQVGRLIGSGDQKNFFRQASGPGWVLVGDAGHHKDSITARGITDAFLQAELLGQSLAGRFGAAPLVDQALAEFAAGRDTLVMESYLSTLAVGDLEVTERRRAMFAEVAESPEFTQVYLGVLAGIRPAEDLTTAVHGVS